MVQFALVSSALGWLLALAGFFAVEDWSQWRGPHRDGQVAGVKAPAVWPKALVERWQVEVGLGHSSPVVADQKIYIFTRRGDDEVLACLSLADGKQLWQHGYPAPYQVNPVAAMHGKGPKSTPAVVEQRVFTLGINGIVTCWDAGSGKQVWQRDFSAQFPRTSPLYGAAMSPVVAEDKCVVHVGGHDKGALMALDSKSGQPLWSYADDGPAYASPVIVTLDDVPQVVTQTQKACIGVDLAEGKLLWKIPFQTEYDQNSVTPLCYENSVIFSGINKGVDRYRIELKDGEWETDKVWGEREVSLYMSSPVADDQRLFGFSHRQKGQLFATDLTTGQTLWTSEGRLGENASLVQTAGVVWALTNEGQLIIFKAGDKEFEPLARYPVAQTPTWAHPVILPSGVLVKDESKLTLWQLSKTP